MPVGRIRIGVLLLTAACGTDPVDPVGGACPPTGGLTVTTGTRIATTCTIAGDLMVRGSATLDVDLTANPGATLSVLGNVTVADSGSLRIRGGTFIIVNDRNGQRTMTAQDRGLIDFEDMTFRTTPVGATGTGSRYMNYLGRDQARLVVKTSRLDQFTAWLLASCAGRSGIAMVNSPQLPSEIYPDEHCQLDLQGPESETGVWFPSPPVATFTLPDQSGTYSWEVSRAQGIDVDWRLTIRSARVGLGMLSRPGSRVTIHGRGTPITGEFKIGYFLGPSDGPLEDLAPGLQQGVIGGGRLTMNRVQLGPIAWQIYALAGARGSVRRSTINEAAVIGDGAELTVDSSLIQLAVLAALGRRSTLAINNSEVWSQSIEADFDGRIVLTNSVIYGSLFVARDPAAAIQVLGGAFRPNPSGCSLATMVDIQTGQPRCNPFRPPGPPQRTGPGTVSCQGTAGCSF
ncbi:MAG: hypothetical protein ACKVZ0_24715 [Gemmatimonadales bacterium]